MPMPLQVVALSPTLSPPLGFDILGAGVLVVGLDAVATPAAVVAAAGVAQRPLPASLALAGPALGMWEFMSG